MIQSRRDNTFFFLNEIRLIIIFSHSSHNGITLTISHSLFRSLSHSNLLRNIMLYDNGYDNNNCYCDVKRNTLTLCERARQFLKV